MIACLHSHPRLLNTGQQLLGPGQRQSQVGDVAQVAGPIDLQDVDPAPSSVSSRFDQLKHQPRPRSPSRPQHGCSYRSRLHPPQLLDSPTGLTPAMRPSANAYDQMSAALGKSPKGHLRRVLVLCINPLPANLAVSDAELHFRIQCYRTSVIAAWLAMMADASCTGTGLLNR